MNLPLGFPPTIYIRNAKEFLLGYVSKFVMQAIQPTMYCLSN